MKILEYSTMGATVQFGQTELLLVMALLQQGRESLGCDSDISKRLDRQFCLTNLLVEDARRESVSGRMVHKKN